MLTEIGKGRSDFDFILQLVYRRDIEQLVIEGKRTLFSFSSITDALVVNLAMRSLLPF